MFCSSRRSAQSLNEYLLPLALVGVVGIVVLGIMGQQLSGMFGGMVQRSSTAGSPAISSAVNPVVSSVPMNVSSGNAQLTDLSVRLKDGSTVQLSGFPRETAQAVETVGSDGTINLYAQSLENFAGTLEREGKVDSDTAALIRKLATQGFGIAQTQSNFKAELALYKASTITSANYEAKYRLFKSNTFDPDGGVVNMQTLRALAVSPNGLTDGKSSGSITSYINTYDEIRQSGILQDPAIAQVIDTAYREILRTNYNFLLQGEENVYLMQQYGAQTSVKDTALSSMDKEAAQAIRKTQTESDTICNQGDGDGSSLIRCTKRG